MDLRTSKESGSNLPRTAISISEFCLAVGISRSRVYLEFSAGTLLSVHSGRRRLIPVSETTEWLERLAKQTKK
jgi:hypothetical protein